MTKNDSCCPPAELKEEQQAEPSGCCPPREKVSCCPPQSDSPEIAGYSVNPFVTGWLETQVGKIPRVSTRLNWSDRRGSWAMRWGFGRDRYQVTPGLYAVGRPSDKSLHKPGNWQGSDTGTVGNRRFRGEPKG